MSIPTTMRAVVVQANRTVKTEQKPVPKLASNEILLKIQALGENPTDWKHAAYFSQPGDIIGCDYVGSVVAIGSEVPSGSVKIGETRFGFMKGGMSPTRGAFAEYVAAAWDLTSVVPDNITPEQAASAPIPYSTACMALYLKLQLPEPVQPPNSQDKWFLVWSGSTSVGQYAIQLAKLSGFRVATTASPHRWDMLKSLGADVVVDYRDPDVVSKLKEATNDSIAYGLDTISENGTIQMAQKSFQPSGGRLITILFDLTNLPREEVKTESILTYVALGADADFGPTVHFKSSPEYRASHAYWLKEATKLFGSGKLKPLPIEVVGGLDDVQKGFELMKENKNTSKLVIKV